jgi:hypothetical protein
LKERKLFYSVCVFTGVGGKDIAGADGVPSYISPRSSTGRGGWLTYGLITFNVGFSLKHSQHDFFFFWHWTGCTLV